MVRATCCALAARNRSSSAPGARGSSPARKIRSRTRSARGEPPGSRVKHTGIPASTSESRSREAWVVLPDPSIPSRVIKSPVTVSPPGLDALSSGALETASRRRHLPPPLRYRGLGGRPSLLAVLLDELLDHAAGLIVGVLDRRGLLEIRRGPDERPRKPVVERELRASDRVDDDAGRVRRIPDLELQLDVERNIADCAPLEPDIGPLAVVQPFDVIARPDVYVLLSQIVVEHRRDRVRLRDLLRFEARAFEHVQEIGVPADVELARALEANAALPEQTR